MKTSRKWNFKSIAGMIMLGLVLALMIGSVDVTPAFAKNDKHYKNYKKYNTNRGYHRGHYKQARPVYRDYGYYGQREPDYYYPPPPVVYAPPPPPGIGIFFPPIFIRP
jgi:hypothetical protein